MKKFPSILFILLISFAAFSQNASIKTLYPVFSIGNLKHSSKQDTIKNIAYPYVVCKPQSFCDQINRIIKASVFDPKEFDTTLSIRKLLMNIHQNDRVLKMSYLVNWNRNGLLSLTIRTILTKGEVKAYVYLNFDLSTGYLITLHDLLNTRNDSISFKQAVLPPFTDSVRAFELSLDKNNPNYSEIIEQLNNSLGSFRQHYTRDFILKEREIIVYYNCIVPATLMNYFHLYQVSFRYKTLKNIFKPEMLQRLITY